MKVEVYGGNHSPWVQAVLLALHDKQIDHELRPLPPFATFRKWGVFMPVVSVNGAPWEKESSDILVKLGYPPIASQDLQAVRDAWRGVLHRVDHPLRFFSGFARTAHTSSSTFAGLLQDVLRSFIPFYMFTLINVAKVKIRPPRPDDYGDQYLYWENELQSLATPFLDGEAPGSRDLLLFGIVQCHSSIPGPPLVPLQDDERLSALRQWIGRMHERFSGYSHLYSGSYFEPRKSAPQPAGFAQRLAFYVGLLGMFTALPLTLPLVLYLMRKAPR